MRFSIIKVMENFDVDVCRVGVFPTGELVFYDTATFDLSVKTMRARQMRKVNASEDEASRDARVSFLRYRGYLSRLRSFWRFVRGTDSFKRSRKKCNLFANMRFYTRTNDTTGTMHFK